MFEYVFDDWTHSRDKRLACQRWAARRRGLLRDRHRRYAAVERAMTALRAVYMQYCVVQRRHGHRRLYALDTLLTANQRHRITVTFARSIERQQYYAASHHLWRSGPWAWHYRTHDKYVARATNRRIRHNTKAGLRCGRVETGREFEEKLPYVD